MKLSVIFIHGVDDQNTNFGESLSKNIIENISKNIDSYSFGRIIQDTSFESLVWADSISSNLIRYEQLYRNNGLWKFLPRKIAPLALSILSYTRQKHSSTQNIILDDFVSDFNRATKDSDKIIVIAHSLGSVVAFDYLFSFTSYSPKHVDYFITMGSPLGLFVSAMGHADSRLTLPNNVGKWLNIYAPNDPIATPVGSSLPATDVPVYTNFLPISAHTGYWKNKNVAKIIAQEILACQK